METVIECFKDPNYSDFTREAVRVGEAIETLGYKLQHEYYSQGKQTFHFTNDTFNIDLSFKEEE